MMVFATQHFADITNPEAAADILNAALDAADPCAAVKRAIHLENDYLAVAGVQYHLQAHQKVVLIGAGKASAGMARGVYEVLGDSLTVGAVILKHFPEDQKDFFPRVTLLLGSHPVPDAHSVQATEQMLAVLNGLEEDDLVLCVISGGGSALMTRPSAGVTLESIQALTRSLLACGANISEMNTIRKHLDLVKGGGLARAAYPARLVTLILSDVIDSPLDVIASGPTVADPSTFRDAWDILVKYSLVEGLSGEIKDHLLAGIDGKISESVKPGDKCLDGVQNVLVASNLQSAEAAVACAISHGFDARVLTTSLAGEARLAGSHLAVDLKQALETRDRNKPLCLVAGGETTVTLRGNGLGGRNLEVALGAVRRLAGMERVALVTLATDGEDGPTDAAGAVVTGETLKKAQVLGIEPGLYLANNDSYHFFKTVGGLLEPGATGTNVNDLTFLFAF
jgi:hydroxypyruvate reductase